MFVNVSEACSLRLISEGLVVRLRPQPPFSCGVAKLVRHRTVNAAMRRFESFRHSQIIDLELERQSSGLLSREVRFEPRQVNQPLQDGVTGNTSGFELEDEGSTPPPAATSMKRN